MAGDITKSLAENRRAGTRFQLQMPSQHGTSKNFDPFAGKSCGPDQVLREKVPNSWRVQEIEERLGRL
jgi:hypothetical protein